MQKLHDRDLLIAYCETGDEAAFEEIVRRYSIESILSSRFRG